MIIIWFYNLVLNYILPPRCLSCSEITETKGEFCGNCWSKLDFIAKPYCLICGRKLSISILENFCCAGCYAKKPNYEMARSLLKFNEQSKKIIHQFKYQDKTVLSKSFAKLLCNRYKEEIKSIDLIIPVPMNRFKRLFRKYNPPFILAQDISKIIDKPLRADILIKSKWTKPQTFLSKKERKINLIGSFKFKTEYLVAKKKILLIDDVLTTGSTVRECTKLLLKAGASSVFVMTIVST